MASIREIVLARLKRNRLVAKVAWIPYGSWAVRPALLYLLDYARDRTGVYRVRRTGNLVALRARADLHVNREYLSREGPVPPPNVAEILHREPPSRILDLGANIGLFTLWGNQHFPNARIVAVEPDLENVALLRQNIELNDVQEQVEVIVAAAGVAEGTTRIESGRAQLSRVLDRGEDAAGAVETKVIDALPLVTSSDLVKIDIEGSEWDILRDSRLAGTSPRVLLMEWHKRGSNAMSPWLLAEALLTTAGFQVRHEPIVSTEYGFLWAWRERDPAASENLL